MSSDLAQVGPSATTNRTFSLLWLPFFEGQDLTTVQGKTSCKLPIVLVLPSNSDILSVMRTTSTLMNSGSYKLLCRIVCSSRG